MPRKSLLHIVWRTLTALILAGAAALLLACAHKPSGEDEVFDPFAYEVVTILPAATAQTAVTPTPEAAYSDETSPTPTPTAAPTQEPATLEGKLYAGLVYALNGGEPIGPSFAGERVDIDGDGKAELIHVLDVDGGPTLCIDSEPFLDAGSVVRLASLDKRQVVFISQVPGSEDYYVFYPDRDGNLFCRLFAIARGADASDFAVLPSYEDYVRSGLDLMLHNPMLYSFVSGDSRTVLLDMDGDGADERIVFDSAVLSVNGFENAKILSTTMPRFTYDADHDAIVLYGSAGDYALRLRLEGGELLEEISYASLL